MSNVVPYQSWGIVGSSITTSLCNDDDDAGMKEVVMWLFDYIKEDIEYITQYKK